MRHIGGQAAVSNDEEKELFMRAALSICPIYVIITVSFNAI